MMITLAQSPVEILECFPVMQQLRSHLPSSEFVEQVQQQFDRGYHLAYLKHNDIVVAVAGFHLSVNLAWGRFLYVEDLVVDEGSRSQQFGEQLFQWLVNFAQQRDCQQLHLDSGVQRFDAHRFYLRQRLKKRSGKPCIRGMRITVYDVLSYLASGMTQAEILADFPYLTQEDILACLSYAANDSDRLS
jgi:uncharacterized protein (DUF433 family)